jgi:hypothetical protein
VVRQEAEFETGGQKSNSTLRKEHQSRRGKAKESHGSDEEEAGRPSRPQLPLGRGKRRGQGGILSAAKAGTPKGLQGKECAKSVKSED